MELIRETKRSRRKWGDPALQAEMLERGRIRQAYADKLERERLEKEKKLKNLDIKRLKIEIEDLKAKLEQKTAELKRHEPIKRLKKKGK